MYTYRTRTWVLVLSMLLMLATVTALTMGASPAYPGEGDGGSRGYFLIRRDARLQSIAGVPTVDGLYTGDETNYYVLGQADAGRGTLYFNLVGNTLYLLMRVSSSVNDNVFGMDPKNGSDDLAYLSSVGWSKHSFKDLWKSDHIQLTLTCGSNSWTWRQDYLYDQDNDGDPAEKDWLSDPFNPYDTKGKESGGTPPPGLVSSSSLAWNLNNSPWDITLGGTRTTEKDYKSPYDNPDVVPASYDGFDATHQWEWAMVYEMSMDVSPCGGQDIYVGVTDAHNSPSKDGTRVVPVTPTVVHTPTPSTPTATLTPTATPTSTPTSTPTATPANPPHLEVNKEAIPLAQCEEAEVHLHVNGAGDPVSQRRPLDVMIVLDRSGSMDDAGGNPPQPLTDAKNAAKLLVDQLDNSIDRVGLVSYATTATLDEPLTNDFTAVKNAIDSMHARGYTNIGDAVYKAQQELNAHGRADAVHVMVFLTDGVANRSHAGDQCTIWPTSPTPCTEDAINQAAAAKAAGTVIYTIGLNLNGLNPDVAALARDVLQTMASSPSNYYESPSSSQLQGIFNDIANIITNLAGSNVVVTDILPSDVHYVPGSAVPAPDSVNGQTLTWNLGAIGITQTVSIVFQVTFNPAYDNQLVDVYPDSRVDYTDYQGNPASVPFPETHISGHLCPTPTPTPAPAHIGDYVWNDANGNGLQDEGAGYGINNVTVKLYLDDGDNAFDETADTLVATQTTAGDGGYDFTVSTPGTYWVYVDETSPALAGLTHISGAESQDNPHMVTVSYGDDYNLADFGYAGRGDISGTVFYDWDEDGQQDGGEDGIGSVGVCLYRDNGDGIFNGDDVLQECKNTNPDGTYTFSNYLPGTYLVVETQPDGLQSTVPSDNVRVVHLVVVGATGSAANNDFGEIVKGRIGDFTYNDINGNGVQDSGETSPVQNVTLHITGLDIIGHTVDQIVNTGTSGTYELANLLPGTYTVTAPSVVGGFVLTSPSVQTTTLSVGNMENLNLDFGYIYPTAVSVISVTIQPYVTGVHMEWAVNLNGGAPSTFVVWRAVSGGRWKQLTPTPLEPLAVSGPYAYYGYEDTDVYPGTTYMYRLEDNTGQMFGPWEVAVPEVDDGGSTLSSRRAFLPLIEK